VLARKEKDPVTKVPQRLARARMVSTCTQRIAQRLACHTSPHLHSRKDVHKTISSRATTARAPARRARLTDTRGIAQRPPAARVRPGSLPSGVNALPVATCITSTQHGFMKGREAEQWGASSRLFKVFLKSRPRNP
jgi:hypothetical protein